MAYEDNALIQTSSPLYVARSTKEEYNLTNTVKEEEPNVTGKEYT